MSDAFGDFTEFKGLELPNDIFFATVAMRVNLMSDGELMAAILDRKIAGKGRGPMALCMTYAAHKRGLAEP